MMRLFLVASVALAIVTCGDADDIGIGGQCDSSGDCKTDDLTCLTQFKGGYCGSANCTADADCPDDSFCVTHTDGSNYCFRICTDKAECNENRDADNEANCSSNITPVENTSGQKACVPPSA